MTVHPDLEELRRLIDATAREVDRGDEAAEAANALANQRWDRQQRFDTGLPVDSAELFPLLQEGVRAVHAAEVAGLGVLRDVVAD